MYFIKNVFIPTDSTFSQEVVKPIEKQLSDGLRATFISKIQPFAGNDGIRIHLDSSDNQTKENLLWDIKFINDEFIPQLRNFLINEPLVQEHKAFELTIYYNNIGVNWKLWAIENFESAMYLHSGCDIEMLKKCMLIKKVSFEYMKEVDIKELPEKWYESFSNLEYLIFRVFDDEDISYLSKFTQLKTLEINICGKINLQLLTLPNNDIKLTLKRESYSGEISYTPLVKTIQTNWLNIEDEKISMDECKILSNSFKDFYLNGKPY